MVEGSRILREYKITLGRIEGKGRCGTPEIADYVLVYRNLKIGVVEAKAWDKALTEGVGQAKCYAGKLEIRFTYATNGQGIYAIDMETGDEGEIAAYPTPDELWGRQFAQANKWRDLFAAVPFEDRGGYSQGRYYQDISIQRVLEAIAAEQDRILLTLATGTGKTFIAFQIAWILFHSRWNLSGEPTRRPRILFLADLNNLADQAFNAFSAFPEDAMVRIEPEDIRKKGKVPKNGSIFFTIFQTFMASAGSATGFHANDKIQFDEITEIATAHGYMYILECADASFYTGSTLNLLERLPQHRCGEGAKHTKIHLPIKLVYYETIERIDRAFARGKQVQGWSRAKKTALITGKTSLLKQLSRNNQSSRLVDTPVPELVEGYFGEYPPDFFDFIVIDECNRGGANDEGTWRGILDYFAPAVQLGLTATPKRKDNVDTYAYFGDPVYMYSLKNGINDGFLTPFKVEADPDDAGLLQVHGGRHGGGGRD